MAGSKPCVILEASAGDLALRAGSQISFGNGFSVGFDGKATFEIDPALIPRDG